MIRESRISNSAWALTLGGDQISTSYGANCGAVIGRCGVILIDPLIAPRHARLVQEALARHTTLPVTHVVLTHHHTDHALGSGWFARGGAIVVAHRLCAVAMAAEHPGLIEARRREPELADLFMDAFAASPGQLFEQELRIDPGGIEVVLTHPGHGHTGGDAIVSVPGESVAFCGDLASAGYHVNYEDASRTGIQSGLDALRSLGALRYVPGHGPAGDSELLEEQSRYHRAVEESVERGASAGHPDARIARDLAAAFPGYRLEQLLPQTVSRWRAWVGAEPPASV